MADNDQYNDWIEGFRREVDDAMAARIPATPPPPPGPDAPPPSQAVEAMKRAVGEFEDFWRQETADLGAPPEPTLETDQVNKELDLSRRETRALREELERLRLDPAAPSRQAETEERRGAALERQRLTARNAELESDNDALRRRETEALERLAQSRIEAAKAKDAFESKAAQWEDAVRRLESQVETLSEDRAFLRAEFSRQGARLDAAEAELRDALRRGEALAQTNRDQLALLEGERFRVGELERRVAALHGEAEALRAQTSSLQDRLVRAAAPDREEQARSGLDELRRREADLSAAFEERQKRLEDRLKEATLWLETKLREAGA
jgi:chromosome segregation ATPase